jgi:hypothetical protein
MATNETACRDRDMALAILRTITEAMKAGTQRAALVSVAEWLQSCTRHMDDVDFNVVVLPPGSDCMLKERDLMSDEQRKARAAFYLEGGEP